MKTITRCSQCGTAFRVYEHQLQAREGRVRCGSCGTVFDAYATLEEQPLDTDGPPSLMPSEVGPPKESEVPVYQAEPVRPHSRLVEENPESAPYDFDSPAPRDPRIRALPLLAVVALSLLLAAQIAYVFRREIVAHFPQFRLLFAGACARIGCDLPLPKQADLIAIDSSDLQSDGGSVLTLTTVVKNKAAFAQALPALELTLTDVRDQPIARRILRPRDYLDAKGAEQPGIAANGELIARVRIDASALQAAGYRVLVFYP